MHSIAAVPAFGFPFGHRGWTTAIEGTVDVHTPMARVHPVPDPVPVIHDLFIVCLASKQRGNYVFLTYCIHDCVWKSLVQLAWVNSHQSPRHSHHHWPSPAKKYVVVVGRVSWETKTPIAKSTWRMKVKQANQYKSHGLSLHRNKCMKTRRRTPNKTGEVMRLESWTWCLCSRRCGSKRATKQPLNNAENSCMDVAWAWFWGKAWARNLVFFRVKWHRPAMKGTSCV